MATTHVIRVPATTHARLKRLSSEQARPIGDVIDSLLDEVDADVRLWETTPGDGLADEPIAR